VNEQNIDQKTDQNVIHQSQVEFEPGVNLGELEATSNNQDICDQLRLKLQRGDLLIVNPRRKNGLIIYKTYHAEFAGPGAIIGGQFDLDVSKLLAVGNLSLVIPSNSQTRKQAYKMRRQWVRLTKQIIDNPEPTERAQVILNQFEHWFDVTTVADLPDEAFALLVGVLPQTIRKVRNIELL
jgi:hypothetical protein